jgi:hypothetical protein
VYLTTGVGANAVSRDVVGAVDPGPGDGHERRVEAARRKEARGPQSPPPAGDGIDPVNDRLGTSWAPAFELR